MSKHIEDHLQSVKQSIKSIYDSKELCDCEFSLGRNEVRREGHRFWMSISSPVFKAMFYGDLAESKGPIRIPDIEPEAFDGMLQFFYLNEVVFTSVIHAVQILQVAQKYIVPSLEIICKEYIKKSLDSSNVFEAHEVSVLYNMDDVSKMCVEFVGKDAKLLTSKKFCEADIVLVKSIVGQDELNIESELELFEIVERWAINTAEERGIALDEFLPEMDDIVCNIRFRTMSFEDLDSRVGKSSLISKEEKISLTLNNVRSTLLPYPERFSCCTDVRHVPVIPNKEWTLRRIARSKGYNNVLTIFNVSTKSFKVSRMIKLKGLTFSSGYEFNVRLITNKKYDSFNAALVTRPNEYDDGGDYLYDNVVDEANAVSDEWHFDKPVLIHEEYRYWIEIRLYESSFGTVPLLYDNVTTSNLNNMTVTMSDDGSPLTGMIFLEI